MRDLVNQCLDTAKVLGAGYADVRIIEQKTEALTIKNGQVEEASVGSDYGFGVRVLLDGAWGFAGSFKVNKDEIDRVTELAVRIARASATVKKKNVALAPADKVEATYKTAVEIDPFAVPLEEKLELLAKAEEPIRGNPGIKLSRASMDSFLTKKIFGNTEGSYIEQEITECGASIKATAIKGNDLQDRSYPNSHGGNLAAAGFEFVKGLNLAENAPRIAEEAVALLSAKECPSGTMTVILDASQLALQVHESIGHPTELDRVLGMEASFAGTSFLTLDQLSKLRVGSEVVNIVADATIPGSPGSFGYDDEGVAAQRTDIVKEGLFVGYLTSRETAVVLGQKSNGSMRADGWNRIPLIRMTNVNLQPGTMPLEEIIADTKEGLLLSTNRSWSIDDKRLNFQFGLEIGWEIVNGQLGAMIKNPNYGGITPEFWSSCDAIASDNWQIWGVPNCGKGEPMQVMHVAHGASPARFTDVKVGIGR